MGEEGITVRRKIGMDDVLKNMERLAGGRVNDAVKLAFLDAEQLGEIDRLDLGALTEFKRSSNGTVEVKLTDRLEVLERLAVLLRDRGGAAEEFFRALEGQAEGDASSE